MPMHVGQPKPPTLKFVGQPFMVYAHQVHQSSLKIMDVHTIICHIVAKFIGASIDSPGFYTSPGHKERIAFGVMVTAIVGRAKSPLRIIGASKLTSPNYQGIFQQSSLLQVFYQGR